MRSPAATRVSAWARPLFTRTSPERMTRYMCVLGTPLSRRNSRLSSLWPADSASTVSMRTAFAAGPALAPIIRDSTFEL